MIDLRSQAYIRARARRARWRALGAMAVFCVVGAGIGYFSARPVYRAVGVFWHRPAASDSGWVDSQAMMIGSRRIVEVAMRGPHWPTGWAATPDVADDLVRGLSARGVSESLIEVSYCNADMCLAAGRLRAVMMEYDEFMRDHEARENEKRMRLLQDRRSLLEKQIALIDNELYDWAVAMHKAPKPLWGGFVAPPTQPVVPRAEPADVAKVRRKWEELTRRREEAARDQAQVDDRLSGLMREPVRLTSFGIESIGDVSIVGGDARPRRAAWGAVAGIALFGVLRYFWRRIRVVA
jgi:hypothetical protein